jgi:type IV secretory pathway VirB10-like protein
MEMSRAAAGILAVVMAATAGGTFLALRSDATPDSPTAADAPAVEQPKAAVTATRATPAAPRAAARRPKPSAPPASAAPQTPAPSVQEPPPAPEVVQHPEVVVPVEPSIVADNDAPRPVEPPGPVLVDLVVSADSVIGLQVESAVSSDTARVEDSVVAHVTRDVRVGDRVAIPSGARVFGEVTVAERGGRMRDRARLGVRFTSVVLADGTRLPIRTETIFREGGSPAPGSAAKIGGGAIGGLIVGGILGGAKGAAIGGSIGAGAGTAAVMVGGRNHATLPAGSPLTVRLEEPVAITVER